MTNIRKKFIEETNANNTGIKYAAQTGLELMKTIRLIAIYSFQSIDREGDF